MWGARITVAWNSCIEDLRFLSVHSVTRLTANKYFILLHHHCSYHYHYHCSYRCHCHCRYCYHHHHHYSYVCIMTSEVAQVKPRPRRNSRKPYIVQIVWMIRIKSQGITFPEFCPVLLCWTSPAARIPGLRMRLPGERNCSITVQREKNTQ